MTWVDDSARQSYALTGDWLVFATHEDHLVAAIDRIRGVNEVSLADTAKFVGARAALPERRFHSAYVDYQAALDIAGDAAGDMGLSAPGFPGLGAFADSGPCLGRDVGKLGRSGRRGGNCFAHH